MKRLGQAAYLVASVLVVVTLAGCPWDVVLGVAHAQSPIYVRQDGVP